MNKNKIIGIIAVVIIAIVVVVSVVLIVNNNKSDSKSNKEDVKISKYETAQMEYEDYDNGLISMKIPKGWKVEVAPNDYIHYSFKVYNPENKDYMILFGLKQEGFLKSEKARNTWAKLYPTSAFAQITPIDPQTTEAFYRVWSKNAKYSNESSKSEYLPYLNDFTVIEKIGKVDFGGDILRASFKNDKNELIQGVFTATVYDGGSYYNYGADMAPLNVYHIAMMTAPDEEFNNWMGILDYCIGTLEFSQKFMNGFNTQETTVVSTVKANAKIYDEISDMIMDSWNKRSSSYDIISQKRSDATLGYERVYDTDTNEVYKAENGFMDSYSGTKYQAITDDMYKLPTVGYIEKR